MVAKLNESAPVLNGVSSFQDAPVSMFTKGIPFSRVSIDLLRLVAVWITLVVELLDVLRHLLYVPR